MGRVLLALVGCFAATVPLLGCGPLQTDKAASDALTWDCGDFRSASGSSKSDMAIDRLAQEVAKITGNPVGEGKKVQAAIDRLCAGAPGDKVVGEAAVEAVVAGAEDEEEDQEEEEEEEEEIGDTGPATDAPETPSPETEVGDLGEATASPTEGSSTSCPADRFVNGTCWPECNDSAGNNEVHPCAWAGVLYSEPAGTEETGTEQTG